MATTSVSPTPVVDGPRLWTVEEYEKLPEDIFPEWDRVELIEGLIYRKSNGRLRPWTMEEFECIPEGVFPESVQVELIEGHIYEKMGQNDPHRFAVHYAARALRAAFGPDFDMMIQSPLKLDRETSPEPDIFVFEGRLEDYEARDLTPLRDIALVVEVSDSSLVKDRGQKGRLYARYGIREYWVVNLRDRTLQVRREPDPDSEGYVESRVYREGETVTANGNPVAVADLLPKA